MNPPSSALYTENLQEVPDGNLYEFDFNQYLSTLYPSHAFDIQPLTGGLVNHTVRAERTSKADRSDCPASLILKHAPPFVAAIGPDAPFSQHRQVSFSISFGSSLQTNKKCLFPTRLP